MHHDKSIRRRLLGRIALAAVVLGVAALSRPAALSAQATVAPGGLISPTNVCDIDIADDIGRYIQGGVLRIVGRAGASTNRGEFVIINGNSPEQDVDHDGYQIGPQCDYTDLNLPNALRTNLFNIQNPALAIPTANIILVSMPRALPNGTQARVEVYVEIPAGTTAGRYLGSFQVREGPRGSPPKPVFSVGGTNEVLGADRLFIEVEVLEDFAFSLVDDDSPTPLDSLVLRGRAGQRASGVVRVANIGNAPLSNIRLSATDLRSESAVGLTIPAERVTFSTATFSSLAISDTARIIVNVQIPRGFLGGRYRGTLIVQGERAARREIPLVVIVTSSRGILFGNNPVRAVNGDLGQIAFNGDPGTDYRVGIFDMNGLMVYETNGTVFAGIPASSAAGAPVIGEDFAVNVIWPLVNMRGEAVASGMYVVVVQSIVNGQRQLAQDKLMVIR